MYYLTNYQPYGIFPFISAYKLFYQGGIWSDRYYVSIASKSGDLVDQGTINLDRCVEIKLLIVISAYDELSNDFLHSFQFFY